MSEDRISRIICDSLNLRAYTVVTKNCVSEITGIHRTTPNGTYALGRAINATVLLSAMLKPESDQNITVKFTGNGPMKEVQVQADARGNVRGYIINPAVDLASDIKGISFSKSIGAGFLTVTRDLGLKEPYSSVMPLESGEVALDIAYYLTMSEQIPSALILGLNVGTVGEITSSGGILIQTLPGTTEDTLDIVEKNIHSMKKSLGDMLEDNIGIYEILSGIFGNAPMNILSGIPVSHSCRCSRELMMNIVSSLDKKDAAEMAGSGPGLEISCTFCKKAYLFTMDDLKKAGIV